MGLLYFFVLSLCGIVIITSMMMTISSCRGIIEPIQLLKVSAGKSGYEMCEGGVEFLKAQEGNIAIVSVIGRARTGKSFTSNVVLAAEEGSDANIPVFKVGNSDAPETSGAWLWPIPISSRYNSDDNTNTRVFLIDTEGLGSGPRSRDKALLMAMSVASSVMVYHLSEFVYRDDIAMLHGLSRLLLHYRDRGILEEVGVPDLVWVVQRFDLEFSGSAEDVLRNTWMSEIENPNNNEEIARFNFTARFVKEAFHMGGVFLVPGARAWNSSDNSKCPRDSPLSVLPKQCLDAEYVSEMNRLKGILSCSKQRTRKAIDTGAYVPVTGAELAEAMAAAVTMLEDDISLSSDAVADAILLSRLRDISSNITHFVDSLAYPMDARTLTSLIEERRRELRELVSVVASAYLASQTSRTRAESELSGIISAGETRAKEFNLRASEVVCSDAEVEALQYIHDATGIVSGRNKNQHHISSSIGVHQFDAIMRVCLARYMERAVGPATMTHYNSLKNTLENERGEVERMDEPKIKGVWIAGSFLVLITTRALATLSRGWLVFQGIFSLLEIMSLCILVISGWSIIGEPPIEFESMTAVVLGIFSMKLLKIICVVFATGTIIATSVSVVISRRLKKKENMTVAAAGCSGTILEKNWDSENAPLTFVASVEVNDVSHRSSVMNIANITIDRCLTEMVVVIAISQFDSLCVIWVAAPSGSVKHCIMIATVAYLKLTEKFGCHNSNSKSSASVPQSSSLKVSTNTNYVKDGRVCIVNTDSFVTTLSREELRFTETSEMGNFLKGLKF